MRRLLVPAAAVYLALTACESDGDPAGATPSAERDASPSWFGQRAELPSCGIDDYRRADYPHIEARRCFQTAFAADRPAELTRVQYGDERESIRAHFRVLGDARYEIVEQQFDGPPDTSRSTGWVRHECSRFVFVDDPSAESRGAPVTNGAGECEQVEYVSG